MQCRMKISRRPGVWEEVLECDWCEGTGTVTGETFRIDYDHGGYLTSCKADCPRCNGNGWVHLPEEEEEEDENEQAGKMAYSGYILVNGAGTDAEE